MQGAILLKNMHWYLVGICFTDLFLCRTYEQLIKMMLENLTNTSAWSHNTFNPQGIKININNSLPQQTFACHVAPLIWVPSTHPKNAYIKIILTYMLSSNFFFTESDQWAKCYFHMQVSHTQPWWQTSNLSLHCTSSYGKFNSTKNNKNSYSTQNKNFGIFTWSTDGLWLRKFKFIVKVFTRLKW